MFLPSTCPWTNHRCRGFFLAIATFGGFINFICFPCSFACLFTHLLLARYLYAWHFHYGTYLATCSPDCLATYYLNIPPQLLLQLKHACPCSLHYLVAYHCLLT